MKRTIKVLVILGALLLLASMTATAQAGKQITIAYVTNGPYTFWTYAHAGCLKAEMEFGVKVNFFKPPSATLEEQKRFIETQMAKGGDGMAISVIDPEHMTPFLNEIGAQ